MPSCYTNPIRFTQVDILIKTLRPRQNCRHFADKFLNTFSWMKMYEFRWTFYWSLFLRVKYCSIVQIMAWRRPGDTPLSDPLMFSLLTYICVTRYQWVKTEMIPRISFNTWFHPEYGMVGFLYVSTCCWHHVSKFYLLLYIGFYKCMSWSP